MSKKSKRYKNKNTVKIPHNDKLLKDYRRMRQQLKETSVLNELVAYQD